jgi:long-chain acyl-CoA synthetase
MVAGWQTPPLTWRLVNGPSFCCVSVSWLWPDLTDALIDAHGRLRTSNIVTIDADGFVSVTDRKKELIIAAGGENIAPAAVENVLVADPLMP